jgi:hypothetical protein
MSGSSFRSAFRSRIRVTHAVLVTITIPVGLASRADGLPLPELVSRFGGDVLSAVCIFFGVRFVLHAQFWLGKDLGRIRSCLNPVQLRILTIAGHQRFMAAELGDFRSVHHDDEIGHANRREPVRNQQNDSTIFGLNT